MPSVVPTTEGATAARHNQIESEDWPTQLSDASSPRSSGERMQFNGDGLNTGVRILGMCTAPRPVLVFRPLRDATWSR